MKYISRPVHCATSPALLPYGYIIGSVDSVSVTLTDPVSALALETLVPRSVLARYLALVRINDYNMYCQLLRLSKLPLHMFIPDKFVSWHIATSQWTL